MMRDKKWVGEYIATRERGVRTRTIQNPLGEGSPPLPPLSLFRLVGGDRMIDPGSNPYRIAIHYLRQAIHQADDPRRHEELLRAMEVLARKAVAAERRNP